jgi:hypothetical protein
LAADGTRVSVGLPAPAADRGVFLGGERVRPQPGQFYAGWITDDIEGPFKGEPGTLGW